MHESHETVTTSLTETQRQWRRRRLRAEGRQTAWAFAVASEWNIAALRDKLHEKEAHRDDAAFAHGSMRVGASPRLHLDAYIDALKSAIRIVEAQQDEAMPIV